MTNDAFIKKEEVLYLKSQIYGLESTLFITSRGLCMYEDDRGIFIRGIVQFLPFLRTRFEKTKLTFDVDFAHIRSIAHSQQGFNKNVLEITDNTGTTYRVIVKDYKEWEKLINANI